MEAILTGTSVVAATLVIFAYLLFIWWLDRYEREPFWLVILTFLYGGIFGIACGCLLSVAPSVALSLLGQTGDFLSVVVVAPVAEEFTKGFVFLFLMWSRHFDNETDGLIYGAATGLGFACVENLLYFASAATTEDLMVMVVLRTLFTALVHCISSATLGMAFGHVRRRGTSGVAPLVILGGYALAVINHGVWNLLASLSGFEILAASGAGTAALLLGCLLVVLAAVVMFGLTQYSLRKEHDALRKFLEAEAVTGTLPVAHAAIIPYWLKRRRSGWLEPHIPRQDYVRAATMLAFRQHQLASAAAAGGGRREELVADITRYRGLVRSLVQGHA